MGYFAVTLTFFISTILSCSSDYDYSTDVDIENLSFITIKTEQNRSTVGVNETVTFFVIDDETSEDITQAATFYIDGQPLSGNYASFDAPGTYVFSAAIDNITSNLLTLTVVDGNYVTISTDKAFPDETVNFHFYDTSGNEFTESASFSVNQSPISGSTYSTPDDGTYTVTASYQGEQTQEVSYEVYTPKRKVTFEDYTGAWCGWCPRVATAGHELQQLSDHVIVLAVHNNDEMAIEQESQMREQFNVLSFPAARLNRTVEVPNPEDGEAALNMVLESAATPTHTSIAIDAKLNGSQLKVATKIRSRNSLPASHKIVVYLYQDGLVFPQTNYYENIEGSPWYQAGNPIEDFVHNEVLEASLTNIFGDAVESTAAFEEYIVSFDPVNLSSYGHSENDNTFDPQRFGVIVMLVDENNNAINAQRVHAGENIGYE